MRKLTIEILTTDQEYELAKRLISAFGEASVSVLDDDGPLYQKKGNLCTNYETEDYEDENSTFMAIGWHWDEA